MKEYENRSESTFVLTGKNPDPNFPNYQVYCIKFGEMRWNLLYSTPDN